MKIRYVLPMLMLSTLAVPAAAYVPATTKKASPPRPLRWMKTNCVKLRANSNGSADISDGSDVTAIENAVQQWVTAAGSCSYLTLDLQPAEPTVVSEFNDRGVNENAIVFIESGWEHDAEATGVTLLFFIDGENSESGRILDADIELNGDNFIFSSSGEPNKADIENTVVHELGHLMGLDHTCAARPPAPMDHMGNTIPLCAAQAQLTPEILDATMFAFAFPGETKKRTPEADDVLGVCETYPLAEKPGECTVVDLSNRGGCAVGGEPSTLLWLLLGLVLGRRHYRRR